MSTLLALVNASMQFLVTVVAISDSIITPISEKVSIAASNLCKEIFLGHNIFPHNF
jgi:hypothetical protein